MAKFDEAIGFVLENEGGYANDPNDPGGETKYGISKRSYPLLDIKSLTVAQAEQIYERDYWNPLWGAINAQPIATMLLDMAVSMGVTPAIKLIQRAAGVDPDGVFGPATAKAINSKSLFPLLSEIRARRAVYYAEIAMERSADREFLLGWMRRVMK